MMTSLQQSELFGDALCPTRLVPDAPAEQDWFGPHHDVASALATLVRTEDGGQSIGLSGKWGAGKSTVVHLLRQDLATAPSHKTWVFDAWAHEGDPLRRTFLESLITFLSDINWVNRQRWEKRVAELAGRRRESIQHTSPRLSSVGRMLALSAVMVPLGTALFADGLKAGLTLSRHAGPVNWQLILGAVLALGPIWVITVEYGRKWWLYWLALWTGQRPDKPEYNEVLAIFEQKALTETLTETLETPEPTSIEFERVFAQLMDEALAESSRRLVLVVDNLDRIDAADALKIWSTLQTFLQHRAHRQQWLARLWVVMPFDPVAIKRLWEQEPESGGGLAASFLDKSFQILFDVPAPLASDWREYLIATLSHAFPKHKDDEFHTIYRIVAVLREPTNAPTPRELKIIVNQIGAIHRQRQHTVPLAHIAYYVMLRRGGHDVICELRANTLPQESDAGLLGKDARDSLAAMAFGVAPDKARQFLLEPPIVEALANGDADGLSKLKDAVGFDEVLEDALRQSSADWPKAEGGKLLQAVSALVDAGVLDVGASYRAADIQRELVRSAKRIEVLAPLTPVSERGVVLLAQRSDDPDLLQTLFDAYSRAMGGLDVQTDKFASAEFVSRVRVVVSALADAGLDLDETDGIPVPGSAEAYVQVCRAVMEMESRMTGPVRRVFVSAKPDQNLVTHFEQAVRQKQLRAEHRLALESTIKRSPDLTWKTLFAAARERMGSGNVIKAGELIPLLGVLTDQQHLVAASTQLSALVTEGSIAHHIYGMTSQQSMDGVALCIFAHVLVTSDFASSNQIGNTVAGYANLGAHLTTPPDRLPESLANLLYQESKEELLLDLLDAAPIARPLVAETIGVLVMRDELEYFFTPEMVYERWPDLDGYVDAGELLRQAHDDGHVMALAQEGGFQHDRATLYTALLQRTVDASGFRAWCVEGLRGVSEDVWLEQLPDGGSLLDHGLLCQTQGESVELADSFRSAAQRFAKQIARSESGPSDRQSWSPIFALLAPDQRDVLLQQVYEVLQDNAGAGAHFFQVFGPELAAANLLSDDRSAFTRLLEPFLRNRNVEGLRWVQGQLTHGESGLKALAVGHRKVFKQQLAEELRDGEGDKAHDVVVQIAAALGVRSAKTKTSKDESTSDA
jgi:hypothetical protein